MLASAMIWVTFDIGWPHMNLSVDHPLYTCFLVCDFVYDCMQKITCQDTSETVIGFKFDSVIRCQKEVDHYS